MAGLVGRFKIFVRDFSDLFYVYRKDRQEVASHYLSGLLQASERKNMEQISLTVPGSDHQAIQQFVTDTGWDAQAVMARVAENVNELIGSDESTCLIIDESGFRKKGKKSVGVARQWLGNIGKVDNCQIGVFAALCKDNNAALINSRLYLPGEWTSDRARCEEAKIPLNDREFSTKENIAIDFVRQADALGMRYNCVCTDAGYGKGFNFCETLHGLDKTFIVDIHSDIMVYEKNPRLYVPEDSPGRGRKHTRLVSDKEAIRVDELIAHLPQSEWSVLKVRKSTKGHIRYEYAHKRIWVWVKDSGKTYQWHLIARRNAEDKNDYKYSLSNAPESIPLEKLAYFQAQRYWIERVFEDYKSSCGMSDYEVRSWNGWHHHMAMVMMAGLFMLSEKLRAKKDKFNLTCKDIEYLLKEFLPKRFVSDEEIMGELYRRIKFREAIYNSYYE
jgi:SRSO17 transposase